MSNSDVEKLKELAVLYNDMKELVDKNTQSVKDHEGILQEVSSMKIYFKSPFLKPCYFLN